MESYPDWQPQEAAPPDMGEFQAGTILEVDFWHSGIAKGAITPVLPEGVSEGAISLEIVTVFPEPGSAITCLVRQVSLDEESSSDQVYLLRLFDRRYARDYRGCSSVVPGPWTRHREKRYRQYLAQCGGQPSADFEDKEHRWDTPYRERIEACRTLKDGAFEEEVGEDSVRWTVLEYEYHDDPTIDDDFAGLAEAYLEWRTQKRSEEELEIYKTLHGLSQDMPMARCLGQISYAAPIGDVNGLLIEYIPNCITIRQYLQATVACGNYDDQITRVCTEAAIIQGDFVQAWRIVYRYHKGMKSDFVMVQLDTHFPLELLGNRKSGDPTGDGALAKALRTANPLRFYVAKFDDARLRDADETDEEWGEAKHWAKERMLFGRAMHSDIRTAIKERCKTHGWICRRDRSRQWGAAAIWAPEGHQAAPRIQKPTKKERKEAKKQARAHTVLGQ